MAKNISISLNIFVILSGKTFNIRDDVPDNQQQKKRQTTRTIDI
jgi:hypothetical protein